MLMKSIVACLLFGVVSASMAMTLTNNTSKGISAYVYTTTGFNYYWPCYTKEIKAGKSSPYLPGGSCANGHYIIRYCNASIPTGCLSGGIVCKNVYAHSAVGLGGTACTVS